VLGSQPEAEKGTLLVMMGADSDPRDAVREAWVARKSSLVPCDDVPLGGRGAWANWAVPVAQLCCAGAAVALGSHKWRWWRVACRARAPACDN
jgi:hypothetical protein